MATKIPESNYVKVKFDYVSGTSIYGTVPLSVLFYEGTGNETLITKESEASTFGAGVKDGAKIFFSNGGQQLLLYPYTVGQEETAVQSCLAEYPNVINVCFEKAVSDIASVCEVLESEDNEFRANLLYATSNTTISELNIGDHTNIALVYLPSAQEGKAYVALALAGKMSSFDVTSAEGIRSLLFTRLANIDNYLFDGTKETLNQLVSTNFNVYINLGDRAVVLDGAKMIDGEPLHSAWGISVLETQLRQSLSNALIGGLVYSAQSNGAITTTIVPILSQYVANGLITSGSVYNGETQRKSYNNKWYTTITEGEILDAGYKISQISIGDASAVDKQALRTPPIYIYCMVANNIREIVVNGEVRQ